MTVVTDTMTLAGCRCDGHARMRGHATVLRERLNVVTPEAIADRWASGTGSHDEIDAMRRSLHARKLRDQLNAG